MNCTVTFDRRAVGRNMSYEDFKNANTLKAGRLEHFIPEIITWFHIPDRKLLNVLWFLRQNFGSIPVAIFAEDPKLGYGKLTFLCGTRA